MAITLKFMSEEQNVDSEVVVAEIVTESDIESVAPAKVLTHQEKVIEQARSKLSNYLGRAVEIITELAESSENDRVRLAAAESIADRAGLGKSSSTQVTVSQGEHEAARREAEEIVARLEQNKGITPGQGPNPSLDALIVLEGEEMTTESA